MSSAVLATAYGFGASGNTMGQNRSALQAALNTGCNVLLPRQTVTLHGPLTFTGHGQRVIGDGPDQSVLVIHDSSGVAEGNLFMSAGLSNVGLEDMTIRGHTVSPPVSGYTFLCDGTPLHGGSPGQAAGGDVRNVVTFNMWAGFVFRDVNTAIVDDVQVQAARGWSGVYVLATNGNHRVDQMRLRSVIVSFRPEHTGSHGTGIMLDGDIHTMLLQNVAVIQSRRGLHVLNSAGLPVGQRPAFLTAYDLQVDYSRLENVLIESGHRFRFTDCYFHRAEAASGVVFGPGTDDMTINTSIVSSSQHHGLEFHGKVGGFHGVQVDRASFGTPNVHSGIYLGAAARDVRIIGGGSHQDAAPTAAYGIGCVDVAATQPLLSAATHHRGITGHKNW